MGETRLNAGLSRQAAPARVLVAGVGNVLHGDDGFGVRVVEALAAEPLPDHVTVRDVGIGGIHLVQELMAGYDAVVLVDTIDADGEPGRVSLRKMDVPTLSELGDEERKAVASDTHVVVPAKALLLASAVGALPERVFMVCCPGERMELEEGLSPGVETAVRRACRMIRDLLTTREGPGSDIQIQDELLQVLYWMRGEGLGSEADAGELLRFLGDEIGVEPVTQALDALAERGLVEELSMGRFRLTEEGIMEGGRRFADEFRGLTGQAHGECGDPTCDCHEDPAAAVECLASRVHG